jgi:hypothetical protein
MSNVSRRAVLSTTGRAAVATLSLGGLAVAAPALVGDDPIYAAIEAHRVVQARITEICQSVERGETPCSEEVDDIIGDLQGNETHLIWTLLEVEPTTVAGVAAFLAHITDYLRHGHQLPERKVDPAEDLEPEAQRYTHPVGVIYYETDAIAHAARALTRLTGGHADA